MDLCTFPKRLPKVSLHVHLAGTVQPFTLVELARKNGVALPAYRDPAGLYHYPDIYQFLKMLDLVMASVRDRDDFHRITYETLQQAAEHGVRHREMFWNPTTHMACGVPYQTAVDGIIASIRDARTDFGIQCFLIAPSTAWGRPSSGSRWCKRSSTIHGRISSGSGRLACA
jgi:adenosine deaminase